MQTKKFFKLKKRFFQKHFRDLKSSKFLKYKIKKNGSKFVEILKEFHEKIRGNRPNPSRFFGFFFQKKVDSDQKDTGMIKSFLKNFGNFR